MTKNLLIIAALNVGQAREYCRVRGLVWGVAAILTDAHSVSLIPEPEPRVRLIGGFHQRPDAKDVLAALKTRRATVEDCTHEVVEHV